MRFVYLPLLALLLITYAYVLNRVKKNSAGLTPLLGWLTGLAFFLMIPLTVITLNGGYKSPKSYDMSDWGDISLSNPNYLRPYIWVWLSLMLACAVAYFLCPTLPEKSSNDDAAKSKTLERAMLVMIGLAVVDWAVMIVLVGGIEAFLISHWYTRVEDLTEQYGTAFVLFDHANEVNQIAFSAAAALYTSLGLKNRSTKPGFTALILVFLLAEIVMSGNRIFFALYLLAFLMSCWVFNRKKILVTMVLASPLIALIFGVWAAVRHDLSNIAESTTTYVGDDSVNDRVATSLIGVTEGTDVVLMMHVIDDFGGRFDYLYGSTYGRVLTSLVPRSIYPHRPRDFTVVAASLYEPGANTSLNATALGEAYANFGVCGFALLPVVTWIACRYTDRQNRTGRGNSLASAVAFVMLIWFARVTLAESLLLFLGAGIFIWVFGFDKQLKIRSQQDPAQFAPISPL
jgi:oligosaccharide repeat unit polymerase